MFLILDSDIPYEQEILKASADDITPWLRYIQHKSDLSRPLSELVFVYERACRVFPRSYKLWKAYLDLRVKHVSSLNYATNTSEFHKVNQCFERALILLNKMPKIWTSYLSFLVKYQVDATFIRNKFNKALQSVSVYQHEQIWDLYLQFALYSTCDEACIEVFKRYLYIYPQRVEDLVNLLSERKHYNQLCKVLILLLEDSNNSSNSNTSNYISSNRNSTDYRFQAIYIENKSKYQLWSQLTDILVNHPKETSEWPTERIIRSGITRYPDQAGKLWVSLATYFINKQDFESARDVFEEGMTTAMTVRDFSLVFDSYSEMEEVNLSRMVEKSAQENGGNQELDAEIDRLMGAFELLMDRRLFLLSDVLLRQDPNNVMEWEKRIALWKGNNDQVIETYTKALATINPAKANGKLSTLWINYAKFFETEINDIKTASTIFEKATKVPFKSVEELADVYIEWFDMQLRQGEFDVAVKVMETATKSPKFSKIDYFDTSLTPQERLHKSMKIWSYYVDLIESVSVDDDDEEDVKAEGIKKVKAVYERILELKIATPLTIVNYANFLWENNRFEEAFKVYEKGVDLFSYPTAFEIWNIYLKRAIERKLGIERLRDLFEQALNGCPSNLVKPIFLLFGKLEEDRGLVRNAMKIYDRASEMVPDEDKFEMYKYYIERTIENFGLSATRPVFERAINSLPATHLKDICLDFIAVELKLGEIERVRSLYAYSSQFCDPRTTEDFWEKWSQFELEYGNEETYKEMLRIKRSVKAQFNTDIGYVAAQAVALKNQALQSNEKKISDAPVGFVASKDSQPKKVIQQPETSEEQQQQEIVNPDEIDLDMDM